MRQNQRTGLAHTAVASVRALAQTWRVASGAHEPRAHGVTEVADVFFKQEHRLGYVPSFTRYGLFPQVEIRRDVQPRLNPCTTVRRR
jgi:hypothetical protein